MIPRHIHQVWIGDASKMPKRLMKDWNMEGWKYSLWDEKAIDVFGLFNRRLYDFYMTHKCYHGASDVVRIEVLERLGGIYIDADTERLAPIDNTPFMHADFFAVEANLKGRIANGVMGSVPEHPILQEYIRRMDTAEKVMPPWSTIGGTLFTEVIHEKRTEHSMILEPHTFYPFDSKGKKSRTDGEDRYAQHHWGTTHKLYGKL